MRFGRTSTAGNLSADVDAPVKVYTQEWDTRCQIRGYAHEAGLNEDGIVLSPTLQKHYVSFGDEYNPTSILIIEYDESFILENDVNFSQLVGDVIQERIKYERKLDNLDGDQ